MTATQPIVCPVCQFPASYYAIAAKTYKIYKCAKCGLEHTHPVPTEQQLREFYKDYTDVRADTKVTRLNADRQLQILKNAGFSGRNTILDFGTGDGEFVRVAGENCYGIDFKHPTAPRTFQDMEHLPIRKFDFITLWGVLEHLRDPLRTISDLSRQLRANGKIALTTVDAEGVIPYYYKPVEHLTYWTNSAFRYMFGSCGMEIVVSEPYVMLQKREVYLNRLLSRTPAVYQDAFAPALANLPQYVEVSTNEIVVVAQAREG
jgi:SAM-dependent methyltransferase